MALRITLGPRTHIEGAPDIRIVDTPPASASAVRIPSASRLQRQFGLQTGAPFSQNAWDDAKTQTLRSLQTLRWPHAQIAHSQADIDADQAQARLRVDYALGPLVRFGPLQLHGLQRYDATGLTHLARLPSGADYSEAELLNAQQRLAASGYFDSVFLSLAPPPADGSTHRTPAPDSQPGTLHSPVLAQVREAPLKKTIVGIGLSTDSGPRLSLEHTHNRLPLLGWRAVSTIALERDQQRLATDWLALPQAHGWRWFGGAQVQRQDSGDYTIASARLRGGRTKNSDHIDRSLYLQYDIARNQGEAAPPSSASVSAHYAWTGRYFDQPDAPTQGWGLALELALGHTLRPQHDPFVRTLARWQGFYRLGQRVALSPKVRRHQRLALRLEAAAVLAHQSAILPTSHLFFTGGDTTVRGYGYHQIGARTQAATLYGGRYLGVASLEWQRPLALRGNLHDFESAAFIDLGAVADRRADLRARVGMGAGLRWRSPVGPLQADIAYGLHTKQFRLHLRLGYRF